MNSPLPLLLSPAEMSANRLDVLRADTLHILCTSRENVARLILECRVRIVSPVVLEIQIKLKWNEMKWNEKKTILKMQLLWKWERRPCDCRAEGQATRAECQGWSSERMAYSHWIEAFWTRFPARLPVHTEIWHTLLNSNIQQFERKIHNDYSEFRRLHSFISSRN